MPPPASASRRRRRSSGDAILGVADALSAGAFKEPRQAELKKALEEALAAKLPDFPAGSLLIPQLDAAPVTEAPERPGALPAVPPSPTAR